MLCFLLAAQLQPVSVLLLAAGRLFAAAEGSFSFLDCLPVLAVYWLCLTGLGTALALLCRPREKRNWRSVGLFPVFMASWLPLQVLALFKNTTHWRQIRHGGKIHLT